MKQFDRIIGYEAIKKELAQTADILENLAAYKEAGAKTPSGLLIHGAPGLGKTLMAECLIEAAGIPSFTVRKDKADGEFVDFIRERFEEAAGAAPAIVYLDDLDKFANADERHKNAEEFVAVQACIDAARGRDVFVLATANDLRCLPDSLTRAGRFDKQIHVSRPKAADSAEIIKYYLAGRQLAGDLDFDDVAMLMHQCTCAELEATLNEALLVSLAGREDAVSRDSFMEAYFKTRVQRFDHGRLNEPAEIGRDERRRVAVHEAGHAAVYEILAGRSISLATVFQSQDGGGGVCHCCRPLDCPAELWGSVRVLGKLGGRAATDLVYGKADEGSSDDLSAAASMLRSWIENGIASGLPIAGLKHHAPSEQGRYQLEQLLDYELARCYQKAKEVLAANRPFLDALADAIAESDYLVSSDIQTIKGTCAIVSVAA